jgi:hypothetical protein
MIATTVLPNTLPLISFRKPPQFLTQAFFIQILVQYNFYT